MATTPPVIPSDNSGTATARSPWPALWAMVLGFFMILVDTTIVSVAIPTIRDDLKTDYNTVIWVTSAYLLAYAVPLLITGRLGDRFGPKRIYLIGLSIFTISSLWCGFTNSAEWLITARVVQGLGASMLTPQTMAVITRTFPPESRGRAMSLWGATAGVAMLVGPVLGGLLIDSVGWEWIFFVNVPVGIIALALAIRLVPELETHSHSFDWVGVALSAIALFLIVFGIQEGEKYNWGTITGIVSVPLLIGLGVAFFAAFLAWQAINKREPLVPLSVFGDRNFSVSNLAISLVSFAVTSMAVPFMVWAQTAQGWSPTQAGLLMVPMAVATVGLAPLVGRLSDRLHPRSLTSFGFAMSAIAMFAQVWVIGHNGALWELLACVALLGAGSAFLWAPLAATANRNLPLKLAGAGSGVYNTTRQIGAVLGSAAIAAAMTSRISAHLPAAASLQSQDSKATLPAILVGPFSTAMAETLVVPAVAFLLGLLIVPFFERPKHQQSESVSEAALAR
jgi:EmrB/QacA subfamily drug resistance transporter